LIIAKNYIPRRFPPPWTAEETDACFIVRDANGPALAYVLPEDFTMLKTVPIVDPSLIIEANNAVSKRGGKGDATVTMVIHFNGRLDPETLIAIDFRMVALANTVKIPQQNPWIISIKGKKYKLVGEAMFRAAAITPLSFDPTKPVRALKFDIDLLMQNALAESSVDGRA